MDPLTMFSCPFRHDTTLQHHRLLSVTANVTRPRGSELLRTPSLGEVRILGILRSSHSSGPLHTVRVLWTLTLLPQIKHRASSICTKREPPLGLVAWGWESVYGAFIASVGKVLAQRAHPCVCASEKGKPVVRRGRKAYLGPPREAGR